MGVEAFEAEKQKEKDVSKEDMSLPIGIGAGGTPRSVDENEDEDNSSKGVSVEVEETSSYSNDNSTYKRGSMVNGATEEDLEAEREKMGIAFDKKKDDGESPIQDNLDDEPEYTSKYRGSMVCSASSEELKVEREKLEAERKKIKEEETDAASDDANAPKAGKDDDEYYGAGSTDTHAFKRGSMINCATPAQLEMERRKLQDEREQKKESTGPLEKEALDTNTKTSPANEASIVELDDGNVDEDSVLHEKSISDDAAGAEESKPNRFRGSIINGATEDELEKEKAKMLKDHTSKECDEDAIDEDEEEYVDEDGDHTSTNNRFRGSIINGATEEELEKERQKIKEELGEQEEEEEETSASTVGDAKNSEVDTNTNSPGNKHVSTQERKDGCKSNEEGNASSKFCVVS